MSRLYIDPRFQDAVRGYPLGSAWLFGYFMTHRYSQLCPGLIATGLPQVAAERRIELDELTEALEPLVAGNLVAYDANAELVRVPSAPGFMAEPGPTNIKGWFRYWKTMPDSPLKVDHVPSLRSVVRFGDSGETPSATAWLQTFGSIGRFVVENTNPQIDMFSNEMGPPSMGGRGGHKSKSKSNSTSKSKSPEVGEGFALAVQDADPALPFSVDQMLRTLSGSGRVSCFPYDSRLKPVLTKVIQECAANDVTLADLLLAADWLSAGGDFRTDLTALSVAKTGEVLGWVAVARKWHADGRPTIGKRSGSGRLRPEPAPPGAFTKGKHSL